MVLISGLTTENDTFVTKKLGWRIDFCGEMYKFCFDLVKSEISILTPSVDSKQQLGIGV